MSLPSADRASAKQDRLPSDPPRAARAPRRRRVYYTAGPGELIASFQHWRQGIDLPTEVTVTYSSQFFEVCRALDLDVLAVGSSPFHERTEQVQDGPYRVRQRRSPWERWRGSMFHVGETFGNLRHVAAALRDRADVVVLHGGYAHWYQYAILRLFGIKIVVILMVVLRPKSRRREGPIKRTIGWLNAWFFRRCVATFLSASADCTRQMMETTGGQCGPIEPFLPKFRPDLFEAAPAAAPAPPFRVMYAGRMERYKGVFDLLEIARRFAAEGRSDIEFDLCGAGPDLDALRSQVDASGLAPRFRLHGHCDRLVMRKLYGEAHVVIVPTRAEFAEGFNQVVAEAVIAGKPVITSSVCPALEVVRAAAVEVPPDDVRAYGDAILALQSDPALYAGKVQACPTARAVFFHSGQTFDHVLERVLRPLVSS